MISKSLKIPTMPCDFLVRVVVPGMGGGGGGSLPCRDMNHV